MLHPPNCNHSHLDKKIFAYLNVPFSIASGKLMVQINYSLKKDKQNIVFVTVRCRFLYSLIISVHIIYSMCRTFVIHIRFGIILDEIIIIDVISMQF